MAVCMGANPQGLEYGLHYRRAGNRPLDDGKYCLILQKQRPEHFAPAAVLIGITVHVLPAALKTNWLMERFCYARGGKISGGWTQNYGYIVETEHYRYCLRCNPSPGDYNC